MIYQRLTMNSELLNQKIFLGTCIRGNVNLKISVRSLVLFVIGINFGVTRTFPGF